MKGAEAFAVLAALFLLACGYLVVTLLWRIPQ